MSHDPYALFLIFLRRVAAAVPLWLYPLMTAATLLAIAMAYGARG